MFLTTHAQNGGKGKFDGWRGTIFDFHVDVQDSILIVRTCYKYVFGSFWLVKTPPNDFRTVWETENHFWPDWNYSMALNKCPAAFSTYLNGADWFLKASKMSSKRLQKDSRYVPIVSPNSEKYSTYLQKCHRTFTSDSRVIRRSTLLSKRWRTATGHSQVSGSSCTTVRQFLLNKVPLLMALKLLLRVRWHFWMYV